MSSVTFLITILKKTSNQNNLYDCKGNMQVKFKTALCSTNSDGFLSSNYCQLL